MRVFCPEHKKGFFAPRQNPIKCENRGHLLGEIDFEGQATSPVDLQWQYCCNCEHFCPADFDQYGLQVCPVCTRRSSLIYVCARCYVISFESNTPLQTKNFTLTGEGVPQPSCPGCLRPASADLHEHTCDAVNATFITGLSTCPICDERLDIAPAFPSLVANYLKRTKAAHKVSVTFDYETGLFVPVEDGEFVVITNLAQPVVLPRAPKFSSKRDFYEFYQDYYHCSNPDAGDVQITQPAFVTDSGNGWNLVATGLLEVVKVIKPQPKKTVAPVIQPPVVQPPVVKREEEVVPERPVAAKKPVVAAKKEESGARACPDCGSMIEDKYSFCWKCGHALEGERKPGKIFSSTIDLDDELTVQHEARPFSSTVLPWTAAKHQEHPSSSRGSVLKLLSIGGISLLLVSLGLFTLTRSDTETASATVAPPPPVAQASQPQPGVPVTTEVSRSAPAETTTQQVTADLEDELKKLQEKRESAKPSERPKIYQALAKVEKQYPGDYRFPYERAKLAMKGSHSAAALKALTTAAEKAIQTGKASEMLNGLEEDKTGDFSKISQGRFEWSRLVAALKRNDTSLLGE